MQRSIGAVFFSCREEKTHYRADRDHREKCFCSRQQGLQGYGSLFVDPQSLPASLFRDLCGETLPFQILLMSWFSSTRFGAPSLAILIIARPTCSVVVTYCGKRAFHTG